jgi:Flp pilus assembly pilin Flp
MNEMFRNRAAVFAFGTGCANNRKHTDHSGEHDLSQLDLHQGALAVKALLKRIWQQEDGVLSFEWTVLTSLLTVGVVSGIAAVRDAAVDEMGDLAQAMVALDQSYVVQPPLAVQVHTVGWGWGGWGWSGMGGYGMSGASGSAFLDAAQYHDCTRVHMKVQEFPRRSQQPAAPAPGAAPAPEEEEGSL